MKRTSDDWHCWWTTCEFCGNKYHRSERNCECLDDMTDCECGENDWLMEFGKVVCSQCESSFRNDNF